MTPGTAVRASGGPFIVIALLVLLGTLTPALFVARQEPVTTVTGCVERDAASRTPIFKLIVTLPDGRTRIYQLNANAEVDVAAAVGKIAEASGVASVEKRAGREVHILTVKALKIVAEGCR